MPPLAYPALAGRSEATSYLDHALGRTKIDESSVNQPSHHPQNDTPLSMTAPPGPIVSTTCALFVFFILLITAVHLKHRYRIKTNHNDLERQPLLKTAQVPPSQNQSHKYSTRLESVVSATSAFSLLALPVTVPIACSECDTDTLRHRIRALLDLEGIRESHILDVDAEDFEAWRADFQRKGRELAFGVVRAERLMEFKSSWLSSSSSSLSSFTFSSEDVDSEEESEQGGGTESVTPHSSYEEVATSSAPSSGLVAQDKETGHSSVGGLGRFWESKIAGRDDLQSLELNVKQ